MRSIRRWLKAIHDLPLRYKIIVPVVLVEIAVFVAVMRVSLSSVRSVADQSLHAEARARLRLLGAAYLQMTLTGEHEYFRDLVGVVSHAQDVIAVELLPVDAVFPSDTVIALAGGVHRFTTWEDVQVFDKVAAIGITYTDRAVVQAVSDARTRYVWLFGLGVLLTSAVLWACILAVTDPVSRIAEAANRFADGERPSPLFIARNDEVGILAHAFDTMVEKLHNAQRQLEVIIADRTQQLEAMFHNTPVGVLQIRPDRKVQAVNPTMAEMIGHPSEEIVGRSCYAIFGVDRPCEDCVLKDAEKPIIRHMCTLHAGTRDERFLETTVVRVHSSNGGSHSVMELAHDVTEERRLQAQLLQSSKLASIGQLASGIAHEINNPLATIRLRCDSLKSDILHFGLADDIRDDVEAIERQLTRVSTITQELLTFSRCSAMDRELVDLHEVITSAFVLVDHRAQKRKVVLKRRETDRLPTIIGNRTQLEQVVVNLLHNAIDASAPTMDVVAETRRADGEVELSVHDHGEGIPEADLERIFEPFYTSKDVGEGTGLGLSISYGIVSAHGGTISVETLQGSGTTVRVKLPVNAGSGDMVTIA